MSEYCNDLCELWELLEEMPAELEAYPFWSCNTENEWFSLCKETVGAGFGFKAWWRNMDGPEEQHVTARSSPCGLDFSFGWPSDTSPVLKSVNLYNNSEPFPRFENWKRFRKGFPSAPYNSQGLRSELSKYLFILAVSGLGFTASCGFRKTSCRQMQLWWGFPP